MSVVSVDSHDDGDHCFFVWGGGGGGHVCRIDQLQVLLCSAEDALIPNEISPSHKAQRGNPKP